MRGKVVVEEVIVQHEDVPNKTNWGDIYRNTTTILTCTYHYRVNWI